MTLVYTVYQKEGAPYTCAYVRIKNKGIEYQSAGWHSILEHCRPLYEYSWFIQRSRDYIAKGDSRERAITQAVKDCERERNARWRNPLAFLFGKVMKILKIILNYILTERVSGGKLSLKTS